MIDDVLEELYSGATFVRIFFFPLKQENVSAQEM